MQAEDVPLFITNLGIPLPPDEVDKLIKHTFLPDEEGKCDYYKILHWFRRFTADSDADQGGDLVEFEDLTEKNKKKTGKET